MTPRTPRPGQAPVPPAAYTEEYYLDCASGHDTFEASGGLAVHRLTLEVLDRLGVGPGVTVLDIGSGRGEVVLNCAARGAAALGVDYSDAALGLAEGMRRRNDALAGPARFSKADAKRLPVADGSCDVVFMMDVVEHLHPWELAEVLSEVRRVLAPSGALFVHTMPNLNYYRWVYPVLRRIARLVQRHDAPADPRSEYEHTMHVNEQSPGALRAALVRAGFAPRVWLTGFEKSPLAPGRLNRLAGVVVTRPPLRRLGAFHIMAIARV